MDITLDAKTASINTGYFRNEITIELSGVSESEVLEQFKISDIVNSIGKNEILDEIGIDWVKNYFDLVEAPEE